MEEVKENWHLEKRISLGHLVTTGSLLFGLVLWGAYRFGVVWERGRQDRLERQRLARLDAAIRLEREAEAEQEMDAQVGWGPGG